MNLARPHAFLLAGWLACSMFAPALAQDKPAETPKPAVAEELPAPAQAAPAQAAPAPVAVDPRVPSVPAAAAPPSSENAWRFKQHDGRWWYWLPSNRWIYWENGSWVLDAAATDRSPVTDAPSSPPMDLPAGDGRAKDPANAWRFKMHEGRWWYYQPDNSWMIYSDAKQSWVKYDPATFAQEFPAPAPQYVYRSYGGGYSGGGYNRPRSSVNLYLGTGGYGGYPYRGYGYPYGGYGYPYGGFGYPYGGGFGYPYGYGGSGIYFGRSFGGGRSYGGVGIGFGFN